MTSQTKDYAVDTDIHVYTMAVAPSRPKTHVVAAAGTKVDVVGLAAMLKAADPKAGERAVGALPTIHLDGYFTTAQVCAIATWLKTVNA